MNFVSYNFFSLFITFTKLIFRNKFRKEKKFSSNSAYPFALSTLIKIKKKNFFFNFSLLGFHLLTLVFVTKYQIQMSDDEGYGYQRGPKRSRRNDGEEPNDGSLYLKLLVPHTAVGSIIGKVIFLFFLFSQSLNFSNTFRVEKPLLSCNVKLEQNAACPNPMTSTQARLTKEFAV